MKTKKERIPIAPDKYTTGDDQKWTYEYSWEDFEASINVGITIPADTEIGRLKQDIHDYFAEHPEKLLKGGFCKREGYSVEQIRKMLTGRMPTKF